MNVTVAGNASREGNKLPTLEELNWEYFMYQIPGVVLLCFFFVPGVIGNGMTFYLYTTVFRKVASSYFICTLACYDLYTNLIIFPLEVYLAVHYLTVQEEIVCKFYKWGTRVVVVASVFTLACIAVDRYLKICHPNVFISHATVKVMCTMTGVLSIVIHLPALFYFDLKERGTQTSDRNGTICNYAEYTETYYHTSLGILFIIVFILLTVCYSLVYCQYKQQREKTVRAAISGIQRRRFKKKMQGWQGFFARVRKSLANIHAIHDTGDNKYDAGMRSRSLSSGTSTPDAGSLVEPLDPAKFGSDQSLEKSAESFSKPSAGKRKDSTVKTLPGVPRASESPNMVKTLMEPRRVSVESETHKAPASAPGEAIDEKEMDTASVCSTGSERSLKGKTVAVPANRPGSGSKEEANQRKTSMNPMEIETRRKKRISFSDEGLTDRTLDQEPTGDESSTAKGKKQMTGESKNAQSVTLSPRTSILKRTSTEEQNTENDLGVSANPAIDWSFTDPKSSTSLSGRTAARHSFGNTIPTSMLSNSSDLALWSRSEFSRKLARRTMQHSTMSFVVVSIVFFISHIVFIIAMYSGDLLTKISDNPAVQNGIQTTAFRFSYLQSMYKPLIYWTFNRKFQVEAKRAFCKFRNRRIALGWSDYT